MKKILNKKFITIAIVGVVFFTAIIYMLLNGVDLKNLLSDVNSASNYKTADWSDAKNIDAGYSHSTIFLSKDTKFSVYLFGTKYTLDNNSSKKYNEVFLNNKDDSGPFYEQSIDIPKQLEDDIGYTLKDANVKIYWKKYNDIYFPRVDITYPNKKMSESTVIFPGFGFLIENAGIDNKGERFDAYLKIGNISFYGRYDKKNNEYNAWVSALPYYCIDDINATTYPFNCTQQKIQYGEPLNFEIAVNDGVSNSELRYYKKGTFEYNKKENSNFDYSINKSTAAIDKIGGLFSDIDIFAKTTSESIIGMGHEAIDFSDLKGATIYYDVIGETPRGVDDKVRDTSESYIGAKLSYKDGILYISQSPYNVSNLRKSTSAYALETSGANSYIFYYSAVNLVHIYFSYLSPFKYELEAPKKKTSESEVTDNTSYNYLISQYIPNNSTNKLQKFIQSTNNTSSFYDSITMSDTFDDNLTFNLSDISIKKEDNIDVTECFSLSKSGNIVTAVINKTAPSSCSSGLTTQVADFYNHTYTMIVPVTTKTGIDKNVIKNKSKTVGVSSDNTEEELTSNTTETKVYYNVIENYKDMDGNVISNPVTNRVYREENFTSNKIDITGYTYNHVISDYDSNDNTITSGVITKDVNITYYYDKLAKITSNYYVCNNYSDLNLCNKSENKIIDSVTETKKFGDSYNIDNIRNTKETKNKSIFLKYDNVGVVTTPSISPIGTITSSTVDNNNNITINFYYRKKSNITINYVDKYTNNKIDGISSDVINNHYGDSYNTEESRTEKEKNTIFNDYDYTNEYAITPENTSLNGTINTDNIIVNYYYKKKAIITVNYYKEGTTEKLADSDTLIKYYGDTYDVSTNEYKNKSTIPSKYEYSSVNPSNELKGTVNQDTVTINYYYKLKKAKIIINYYKEGTTEKLADTTTLNQTYDDKYDVTSYKDNKSISMDYRYVSYTSTPENALSGKVSQDTITVNYYYALKEATVNIKYLDELTGQSISNEESIQTKYGVEYSSLNLDSYKKEITGYDYSKTETTPTDITGKVNQDTTTITHYYKKKATITVNYYKEGTTEKLADSDTLIKYYGDSYDVSTDAYKHKSTIPNKYEYASVSPANKVKGTVSQDTITVNYYYKLKKAKIIINYYKEGTTEKLADTTTLNQTYDDKYDVTSYKDNKSISMDYRYVSYTSTPENALSGIVSQDTITVNYYYALKEATINIKYLDELTNENILNEENINTKYGVLYNTLNLDSYKKEIPGYNYSKTETTPRDITGKVNQDTTTITHYYKKKSNITIKYYDIETNKEITKENVDSKVHYGDIYNVEAKKIKTEKEEIFKNYNFERYDSNSKQKDDLKQIKIDNENVTVDLYYRLKTSTITIKYLEETTNKELAETYTKSMKYTEVYNATEIRDKAGVPKNYNLVRHESSTGVLSGTISEPSILIIFYYEKKDPKLETSVSKTGTKEITRKDAEVGYKLNYKAVIKDYIGNAKVTYIDKLPYEIDEEKSDISGGKYNKESKTIIWEETYEKIDMEKEITFTKEINVVYIGIEDTDRIMTNEIETTIKLDNKESIVTSDYDTDIKIPGEIVIHYYDKETKEKLTKDIEKTDLIGNQYVSEEKEFEGYKLVSKPESNVHIYKEKKQEFSYEYEKIKFKITTKVEGEGGTIEGDEIVKYGEDSSKDKIKIKAKEGYEINKITINGESYEITDRNEIIMPYFKEVKEDKEIIVSFVKKIENPKTLDNIMSYIGYAVLSIIGLIISGIVLIKNKTQEKI